MAESGLEDSRATLYNANGGGDFSAELVAAAGPNGVIDVDPDAIQATYDSSGNVTAFTGYGDDVPLRADTAFEAGRYIAFLTNDALDGTTTTVDSNGRVMLTAVGAVPNESTAKVQAIIEQNSILPTSPPAAVLLLGPAPDFESGNSAAKEYIGEDCDGAGVPNLFVPVVGTIGAGATADAETGVNQPGTFSSGSNSGLDTVADLTDPTEPTVITSGMGTIDPAWTDCDLIHEMVEDIRGVATVECPRGAPCTLPSPSPGNVIFVDDDLVLGPGDSGSGLLLVTGQLTMHGNTSWSGMILVVGEGRFLRNGGGNGAISGAMIVADIAGVDNVYDTSDDCNGGFEPVIFDERGGGNGDTVFCTVSINAATPVLPYQIVDFLQR